ncbi:MAG: zinc ribbon domain-containing protein [Acidobacteriota bacterium]|jgi:putative FmdB family regulatory protein|nr:MAG: transcriptional regulator [Acidobacteriota bacterium]
MPLYEYLCGSCGHRFERIQKFSDAPVSECPSCGAAQVERLISSPAIQFKGTGWYITDYARSKSSDGSGSASSSSKSADTSGSSSGSSETTTAKAEA